jgi:hypothetical protein
MKNKHIKLVKKWLEDNDSVSPEELNANADAADAALAAANAAAYAANVAYNAAANAANAANAARAAHWVKRYEELTK